MSHTRTPWQVVDKVGIVANSVYVADIVSRNFTKEQDADNAAFIVKAANSFDTLVETLSWVRDNYAAGSTSEINARIDAALKKAGAYKAEDLTLSR